MLGGLIKALKAIFETSNYLIGMASSSGGRDTALRRMTNFLESNPLLAFFIVCILFVIGFPAGAVTVSIGVPAISLFGPETASTLFTGIDAIGMIIPVFRSLLFDVLLGILVVFGFVSLGWNYFKSRLW